VAEQQVAQQQVVDDDFRDPRLITGEDIVFKTEKHWLSPVSDSWGAVLMIIGALVLAWLQTPQTDGIVGFFNRVLHLLEVVLMLGGVGWIIYNVVSWRSAKYLLTNQRVLFQEGLLRKKSAETLLGSISDVRMTQSFIGRKLGYGNIQIMGASGEAGADNFTSIRKADDLKKKLLEQKVALGAAPAQAMAHAAPVMAAPAAPTQAEIMATLTSLASLRDSGAITPDEYETKKTELLARL
jgi:uncharacterized membrane protein YdbT with pleckstrin-like domain